MPKNLFLSVKTANDIDQRVERILRGLGNPEPPLRLEDVRELLKLDLAYYTANDPSLAQEVISRIRVGSIQVYQRPALLLEAIKKLSLKALYLPDRKRILLDSALPELKHRWNEAHEIGHSLIPWHEAMVHGDDTHTLSQHCHEHVEAEANFAAGRLLFLRDRFAEEARSFDPSMSLIKSLRNTFGNTLSTTLYRFVESVGVERPMVGLIAGHPHISKRAADFDPQRPCRYFIQSPAFSTQFSRVSELAVFNTIVSYCGSQQGGTLGSCEVILADDIGEQHRFYFETFFNRYDSLTLGVHLSKSNFLVAT